LAPIRTQLPRFFSEINRMVALIPGHADTFRGSHCDISSPQAWARTHARGKSTSDAVEALNSPYESLRYPAWQILRKLDDGEALTKLFEDAKAPLRQQARAL
jgi:hypothetical protein